MSIHGVPGVLVVEDEEPILTLVADALRLEGYEVREARDGHEALDVLGAWHPDLILLDLMMHGMTGREFREHQLARGLNSIPLVVVSGARDAAATGEALGAAETLPKPFDLDELVDLVTRLAGPVQTSSK